ncbi:MAG: hypothetical protein A2X67_00835 [Ignavibacteria bacterium GWA2_55_11]|nr:MAG: hypothetical protein A2X67_00835 [Ignavibacteria bacterium GWA2_55_11]
MLFQIRLQGTQTISHFLHAMKSILFLACIVLATGCSRKTDDQYYEDAVEAQKGQEDDEAIELFQEMIKEYPQSPRVPEALYALGSLFQDRKKDFPKAIEMYKKIGEQYPDHATASNALFMVGFINNNELKNVDAARAAYEEFLKKYPSSPLVESARFELANLGKEPAELLKNTEEQRTVR